MGPAGLLSLMTEGDPGSDDQTKSPEARRAHALSLGARLVREEAGSLGAAAQVLAVAQRLPAALAQAFLPAGSSAPL